MHNGDVADFLGGFVAAEGSFTASTLPSRLAFTFAVALGATDADTCDLLHDFFGCGTIHHYPRRKAHYDDEVRFQVRKLRDLIERVVPFMDEHLPASYKREQYLVWRTQLLDYWEHEARRPRSTWPRDESAYSATASGNGAAGSRQSMRGTSLQRRSSS